MLLETTEVGAEMRYSALSVETRDFLENRTGNIQDMALANRRHTTLGTTTCALAEQLNAADTKNCIRRMQLVSVLLQFANNTYSKLKKSWDDANSLSILG